MKSLGIPPGGKTAILNYLDGDYEVKSGGTHVICAVTNRVIPLDELKYWCVSRQEAYASAEAAYQRYIETDAIKHNIQ